MENIKAKNITAAVLPVKVDKSEPRYTNGEEFLNVATHSLGAVFGLIIIVFGVLKSASALSVLASVIFGACMVITYTISSVYHGLPPSKGKRILRVIDHCTVYLLIMGTYSGIILSAVASYSITSAIIVLALQWGVGALAISLTAVDMKKYQAFSFVCYIALGWCIIAIPHIIIGAMTLSGFVWLLCGGLAYTIGSVLYGMGRKKRYMHSVFHIFCLIGSGLQFISFFVYCI